MAFESWWPIDGADEVVVKDARAALDQLVATRDEAIDRLAEAQ